MLCADGTLLIEEAGLKLSPVVSGLKRHIKAVATGTHFTLIRFGLTGRDGEEQSFEVKPVSPEGGAISIGRKTR